MLMKVEDDCVLVCNKYFVQLQNTLNLKQNNNSEVLKVV